jgi:hypothetical protein
MRLLVLLMAPCLALTAVLAQAPVREPVREGPIERLMLDDGLDTDAALWVPAEAVLTVDNKHAKHGDTSLRLHIDVNWETGETNYPIGWPRMYRNWIGPATTTWNCQSSRKARVRSSQASRWG